MYLPKSALRKCKRKPQNEDTSPKSFILRTYTLKTTNEPDRQANRKLGKKNLHKIEHPNSQ